MEIELFCSKHSHKHAKKHCIKCNENLCNECALDFHIEHYPSLQKLKYNSKQKYLNYSNLLCEEIKKLLNDSLNDVTLQLNTKIKNRAKNNLEEYKKKNPIQINYLREQKKK